MKKQRGFTSIKLFISLMFCFVIFMGGCWCLNLVQLMKCDFDFYKSNKCEIVHLIGIIPPAAVVTVWADTAEEVKNEI